MGVMNLGDTPPPTDAHAFKTQQELKTSSLFEDELKASDIKYQVDGIPWTIGYFNQILNPNTQAMAPDINIPSTTLKYNRIDKLDIYVDSGLPNGTALDITGTGIINAGFVPYLGDAFIATLAGGRIGIFVLTAVRKEYYNTHDIYVVDYKLTYFADTSADVYNDLVMKTVRTYVYDKDSIGTKSAPVILAKEYVNKINLAEEVPKMVRHYIDTFFNNDTKYLELPTNTSTYVDQLATDTFLKVSSLEQVPELANIARGDILVNTDTIWDAILNRDISIFNTCRTQLGYGMHTNNNPATRSTASYLGITYTISDRYTSNQATPDVITNPTSARKVVPVPRTTPVDGYIFALSVYDRTATLTPLETVLIEYLNGDIPNRAIVEQLLAEYVYWGYEDQYLLIPILLVLVNTLVSNTYSEL